MKPHYHLDPESGAWRQIEIHLLESNEAQTCLDINMTGDNGTVRK